MKVTKKFGWTEFLAGFVAGSIISIFYSKKEHKNDFSSLINKAEEIKNHLLNKAKNISWRLTERSRKFIDSTNKFTEGKYEGTLESLEKEYYSIKYAVNTAIENYRRNSKNFKTSQFDEEDLFIDFDEETLPKFVGMGKRKR